MRLGFLGTGTIASAVVRGLAGQGHQITVSQRSAQHAKALAAEFPEVGIGSNAQVIAASDVIFLGLLATDAPDILSQLGFRPDQAVISFIAGLPLDQVAALVAPASAPALMLPYPGIAKGGSPILALGDTALLDALFTPANRIFALTTQAQLQAYLCAQAVLSPAAQMVDAASDWLDDGARGEEFLRLLVATSLAAQPAQDLITALNTEGGYNQRLRLHMERAGMVGALRDGLEDLA